MVLLRLLANILLYLSLGLLVYWALVADITALWLAIAFALIGGMLFIVTADVRRSRRQSNADFTDTWDLWLLAELIEIPLRLLAWLFRSLWRIFD